MRCLAMLLMFGLFAGVASAQDDVEYDVFGVPTQSIRVITSERQVSADKVVEFPSCDDEKLLQAVNDAVRQSEKNNERETVLEYRERLLARKNIKNFTPITIAEFKPAENDKLAALLTTIKISKGKTDADFMICAGDNPALKRKVYLLLENEDGRILVNIVNFGRLKVPPFALKK